MHTLRDIDTPLSEKDVDEWMLAFEEVIHLDKDNIVDEEEL